MSLSKALYPLLDMVQPRKTRPSMTEKLLAGTQRIKKNKKKKKRTEDDSCCE